MVNIAAAVASVAIERAQPPAAAASAEDELVSEVFRHYVDRAALQQSLLRGGHQSALSTLKAAGVAPLGLRLRVLNHVARQQQHMAREPAHSVAPTTLSRAGAPRLYFCSAQWRRYDFDKCRVKTNDDLERTMLASLVPDGCEVVPYEAARVHELRPHAGGVVLNISSNCLSFDDACRAVAACK